MELLVAADFTDINTSNVFLLVWKKHRLRRKFKKVCSEV